MVFPYDQPTIAFFSLFFYAMFALFYFSLWLGNHKHVAGLGYWTVNLVLQVLGKGIAVSALIPNAQVAAILGYLLVSCGAIFFYFGLAAFTRTAVNKKLYVVLFFVVASIIIWSVISVTNAYGRSLVYGLFVLLISLRYLSIIWKNLRINPWFFRPFLLLFVLYSILTLFNIVRISMDGIFLLRGEQLRTFDSSLLRISQFLTLALLSGVNFCVLMLTNNTLLSDLAEESQQKDTIMQRLKISAEHDGLTGLLNRNTTDSYLSSVLDQMEGSFQCMVNMVDIDNFKAINDTYGHETGDLVLVNLAAIFSRIIRKQDTVGRWGGDEFLFILQDVSIEEAPDLIRRLHDGVSTFDWSSNLHIPNLKIGISSGYTFCSGKESKKDILRTIDVHLYTAKQNGRNQSVGP